MVCCGPPFDRSNCRVVWHLTGYFLFNNLSTDYTRSGNHPTNATQSTDTRTLSRQQNTVRPMVAPAQRIFQLWRSPCQQRCKLQIFRNCASISPRKYSRMMSCGFVMSFIGVLICLSIKPVSALVQFPPPRFVPKHCTGTRKSDDRQVDYPIDKHRTNFTEELRSVGFVRENWPQ